MFQYIKITESLDPQVFDTILKLSEVVKQTADNVMITNYEGIIEYVNPSFEKTTGYAQEEVIGKSPRMLKSGEHGSEYYQRLWNTLLSGETFIATTVNRKKDGEFFYADQTISSIKDRQGQITHFVSVWRDVTDKILAQNKLKELKEKLEIEKAKLEEVIALDEMLTRMIDMDKLVDFIVEKTVKILEVSKCSLMLVDEKTMELCIRGSKGLKASVINHRVKIGDSIAGWVAQNNKSVLVADIETDLRFHRKNRASYSTKSFLSAPIKLGENLLGVMNVADRNSSDVQVFSDVDLKILNMIVRQAAFAIENAKLYRELKYLSITDPLTNIYNYRHFADSLEHEINRAKRYTRPLSLLMIDVDHFKLYNDTFGHVEGDILLKKISETLKANLRDVDIACRYAGDEFAVILPETDHLQAAVVAQRIKDKISSLKLRHQITVSVGLAKCDKSMNRYEFVLKADRALYEAKREGRNKVHALF